ncbi:MAG TPA: non-heme iron oxygenase ferredoxin subunit [Patescibacteria group bacterium]|nr:non-heme iron oxygenase ferredoxin subunit [Patescibacteria group bacterium]
MAFTKALNVRDLPSGMKKTVVLGGKKIALANIDDEFFAIDDTCSHEQCSLGTDGFLDGNVVTCGCHGAQFDMTSGKVLSLPAPTDVASYKVKVENGEVFIDI